MSYVYKFLDYEDNILYIGKTNNFKNRMKQHFNINGMGHLPKECYENVAKIYYIKVDGKTNVDIYETFLINKYRPKYNIDKQFRELVYLHNNEFIKVEEIDWIEVYFYFSKNGFEYSLKEKSSFPFLDNSLMDYEKSIVLLDYNYYQIKNRTGLYKYYFKDIIKENNDFLLYLEMLQQEILLYRNFNTQYSCFDETISEINDTIQYVAINIDKIKNIDLKYLLIMVQSKMLIRLSDNLYGLIAHTPYALKQFNLNYKVNEFNLDLFSF